MHHFKSAKSEAFAGDTSPHLLDPPAPANPHITNHFPPASPENAHIAPAQTQHPALQGQVAPTAGAKMSLFHWQIHQETQRVGDVSPELLNMQDADGDTYVLMKKVLNLNQRFSL